MILKRQEKDNIIKALYDSSNILASTYDSNKNNLTIMFKSGTQYKYSNVSKSDYMRFEIAESQGSVFNTHIKKYAFEKLGNVDATEIINEANNLKIDEGNALRKAKRELIMRAIKNVTIVNDSYGTEYAQEGDVDKNFLNALEKLKKEIDNYLKEQHND